MSKSMSVGARAAAILLFAFASIGLGTNTSWSQSDPVGSGPDFSNPRGMGSEANGDLIVADFSNANIYRVDALTGDRLILSDSSDALQGDPLAQPAGVVVLPDGRIFVSDLALSAVFEIDPVTGGRTLLAGGDGSILSPFGIAAGVLKGRMMLVVADTGNLENEPAVGPVLVDPDSGEVESLRVKSNNRVLYNDPRAIAVRSGTMQGNDVGRILIGNFGTGDIISVHPESGTRKIISANATTTSQGVGEGASFGSISDMAISLDGKTLLVMDLGNDALVAVDMKTGDRTQISSSAAGGEGSGDSFNSPHGIEIQDGGFMVADFGYPGLVFVADDGTRSIFSITPVAGFTNIRGIQNMANGNVVAADFGGNRIFEVDAVTGERVLVTSGPPFNGPVDLFEQDANTFIGVQFQAPSMIFAVDQSNGQVSVLSDNVTGTGPGLSQSRAIFPDPNDSNRAFVTSFSEDAVVAIDLTSGDRSFVSKDGVAGSGPAFGNPLGLGVDGDTGTIYVADIGANAIYAVAPNGDRTIVSSNACDFSTCGETFGRPFGVSFIDGEIFVADAKGLMLVDGATGFRTLVSAGGALFAVRRRDADNLYVANFGPTQGIVVVNKTTGAQTILSNADNP